MKLPGRTPTPGTIGGPRAGSLAARHERAWGMLAVVASALLVVVASGCVAERQALDDAPVAWVLGSRAELEGATREGVVRWQLDRALWIERVGVALTSGATTPPVLDVRVDESDPWRALEVTFFEEGAANYRIALARSARVLELRVGEQPLDSLRIEVVRLPAAGAELARESTIGRRGGGVSPLARSDALATAPPFVHGRSEWGARSVGVCGKDHDPGYVTVHHTDTPVPDSLTPEARLRQIQDFHIEVRGWCDIGYHFLVSQDGRVWRGRESEARTGAHVGEHNTGNVGIALIGAYQATGAADTMLRAASRTLGWLSGVYFIPRSRSTVLGHREWPDQSTTCPGDKLLGQLGAIIEATFDRDLDGAAGYDDCNDADPAHTTSCVDGPIPLPTPVEPGPVTPPTDLPADPAGEGTEGTGETPDGGTSDRDGDDEGGCAATTPQAAGPLWAAAIGLALGRARRRGSCLLLGVGRREPDAQAFGTIASKPSASAAAASLSSAVTNGNRLGRSSTSTSAAAS